MNTILSIWTVVVFVLFIVIFIWAWSAANQKTFDAAARIPFTVDPQPGAEDKEATDG